MATIVATVERRAFVLQIATYGANTGTYQIRYKMLIATTTCTMYISNSLFQNKIVKLAKHYKSFSSSLVRNIQLKSTLKLIMIFLHIVLAVYMSCNG